jgi:hypothetical protein
VHQANTRSTQQQSGDHLEVVGLVTGCCELICFPLFEVQGVLSLGRHTMAVGSSIHILLTLLLTGQTSLKREMNLKQTREQQSGDHLEVVGLVTGCCELICFPLFEVQGVLSLTYNGCWQLNTHSVDTLADRADELEEGNESETNINPGRAVWGAGWPIAGVKQSRASKTGKVVSKSKDEKLAL